jgi:hypothetical protein
MKLRQLSPWQRDCRAAAEIFSECHLARRPVLTSGFLTRKRWHRKAQGDTTNLLMVENAVEIGNAAQNYESVRADCLYLSDLQRSASSLHKTARVHTG